MDFSRVDENDYIPVYVQIKKVIEEEIQQGSLKPGDKVPSVREVASSAGVNPNTAAKALRDLVIEGKLISKRGEGHSVAPTATAQPATMSPQLDNPITEEPAVAPRTERYEPKATVANIRQERTQNEHLPNAPLDFSQIDENDYTPVYVQIKKVVESAIQSGSLMPGDKVPSVREVASSASVNANTAAKALRDLVLEGTLVSKRGEGHSVAQAGMPQITTTISVDGLPNQGSVNDPSTSGRNEGSGSDRQTHATPTIGQRTVESYVPEFVKVQNLILQQISNNELKPGDSIPSIRAMAEEQKLNPNTVSKAYRELELRGVVAARRGVGYTVIAKSQPDLEEIGSSLADPIEKRTTTMGAPKEGKLITPKNIVTNYPNVEPTVRDDVRTSENGGRSINSEKANRGILKTIIALLKRAIRWAQR